MIKTLINFDIIEDEWLHKLPNVQSLSEDIFDKVINNMVPQWLNNKETVTVNIALSNDEEIRQLNAEFRNIDKPTNILSFANIDDEEFEAYLSRSNDIELGDIMISLQTIIAQSQEQNVTLHDHYIHILIHGILHLLGYDHIDSEEAQEMESKEIKLLQIFNIANPYEEI